MHRPPGDGRAGERPPGDGRATVVLSGLFGVSLLLFAGGYALDTGALRLAGLAGALFFGVGTAPLQLCERARLDLRLGVAGIVGLSVPLIVASAMVLAPLWHPVLAAAVIGAVAVGMHVRACRRVLSRRPAGELFHLTGRGIESALGASIVCIICGNILWFAMALGAGHVVPGVLGFLPKISVFWYAGLLCLLAGIVLARGRSESHAMFGAASLLAGLTLTPAIVYGMPRSQSAAKHIDLVQVVLQAHHLARGAGIYQAYSGFFSAVAWLCDLAGIHDPTGIATYWPFFIGLIGLAELRLFFGRLTSSGYRIWAAITLVILVNAIGADYFSPQAAGFVLGLGVFGLVLGREWPGLDDRMRIVVLVLAGCAMAVTHELSPYIVGGVLVVLVTFRTIRPWYVPSTILLPALGWALVNRHDLSGFISLADLGELSNFAPPKTITTLGLQRLPVVGQSAHALALGLLALIALAGLGFVRTIRDSSSWAFMVSAGVGLGLITVNPYGNEGIFRAALFGIPWLAAVALRAVSHRPARWVSGLYGLVAVAATGTYLVAMFGLDNASVMRPADFQALRIDQASAAADSYLLTLSYGDLPVSVSYPMPGNHFVMWNSLLTPAQVRTTTPDAGDVALLARNFRLYAEGNGGATHELYAVWSPASAEFSVDYGLETLSQAEAWRSLMIASPDWRVVYANGGTYLFREVAPAPVHARVPKKHGKKHATAEVQA